MNLSDTISMMNSDEYKENFKAEYYQLKIRFIDLMNMLDRWHRDELTSEPRCPRSTYELQLKSMREYLTILEMRAVMEKIDIDTSVASCN